MYALEYFSDANIYSLRMEKNRLSRALTVAGHRFEDGGDWNVYRVTLYAYYRAKDKWAYAFKKKRIMMEVAHA